MAAPLPARRPRPRRSGAGGLRLPLVVTVALALAACVRLPPPDPLAAVAGARDAALPSTVRVLAWNVHKERAAGFAPHLAGYLRDGVDLVLLQEACLDGAAPALLATSLDWRIAPSWAPAGRTSDWLIGCRHGARCATGVLTAAAAPPLRQTVLRTAGRELGVTPKTALVTEYAVRGSANTLLVANVHALAFQSLDVFEAELDRVVTVLRPHRGPLLLAGDLNTWTRRRLAAVDHAAQALGLSPVAFPGGARSTGVGFQPLDHVYQRGLRVRADSIEVGDEARTGVSDHNALRVTVELADAAIQR